MSNTITTFLHRLDILRSTNYATECRYDALLTHVRVISSNHSASFTLIDVNRMSRIYL